MTPDFDELIGSDLEPEERGRLRRAHELLVAAGPPPELPPSLLRVADPEEAEIVPFFNRRRHATLAVLAAALALAGFGGGYLVGHTDSGSSFAVDQSFPMRATAAAPSGAIGSLAIGHKDSAGNWPMLVRVANLKKLPVRGYYAVWLTRKGKAVAPCGQFVVSGATTEIRLNVPYRLNRFDGWVVTLQPPGVHDPGKVLLRTTKII